MKPLVVCLDRQTLPVPLPALALEHVWRDHDRTAPHDIVERLHGATVAITNKVALQREHLLELPDLRLIAVAATGYNIIDLAACRERGIVVCNVPAYSTSGVAEHTLMLMLMLRHQMGACQNAVQDWPASPLFCVFGPAIGELAGSTLTLIGSGSIGNRVAELALAFGVTVVRAERRGASACRPGYVPFEQALAQADIVSLHCPLTPETRGIIGLRELQLLKKDAVLINTARGGLVDEAALAETLAAGRLGGAALDVLEQEPPAADNPLLRLQHPNLLLTPHVAWASTPSLQRLGNILVGNIEAFLQGQPRNRVA